MYTDIRDLTQCRQQLVDYLEYQKLHNSDRNSDWFPRLIRDIDNYLYWTVCFKDNEIVAFSTIQKHFFPDDTVRLLTRTFFDTSIRLSPGYSIWVETPVAPMVVTQLNWLKKNKQYTRVASRNYISPA